VYREIYYAAYVFARLVHVVCMYFIRFSRCVGNTATHAVGSSVAFYLYFFLSCSGSPITTPIPVLNLTLFLRDPRLFLPIVRNQLYYYYYYYRYYYNYCRIPYEHATVGVWHTTGPSRCRSHSLALSHSFRSHSFALSI